MTQSEEVLKACPNPWCGSTTKPLPIGSQNGWKVVCGCGVQTSPRAETCAEAIAAWNARPEEDRLQARVAELEGERDEALDRIEELESEAEVVSAEFEKDCWVAVRALIGKVDPDYDVNNDGHGTTANDACEIIWEAISAGRKRAEAAETALSTATSEVERLRAGLERIANDPVEDPATWDSAAEWMRSQARAALTAPPAPVQHELEGVGEPSEVLIQLVADAMAVRTGYSIALTRLVDGVETYTLSMDGFDPLDFEDRDEAAELLHQRQSRDRAKRVLAALRLASPPAGSGVSVAESAAGSAPLGGAHD